MKKQFGIAGAALLASAMFVACGDDSGNNNPIIPGDISSSSGILDPYSSANVLAPVSSSDALIPGSSAVAPIPGSSATLESSSSAAIPVSSSAKAPKSSSSAKAPVSSSSEIAAPSSSSVAVLEPGEKTYKFGYALKNKPRPSAGCGKNSTLVKTKSVENGDRFTMNVAGLDREYFITLPKNYDNKKPYKLLFAMHCMGSNAEDFVHHYADQDHPSPYYGQQKLDTEGNYIFVSPRGDTQEPGAMWQAPWRGGDDKDHLFFDQLLTTMEDNYCIDTSRVFVTGFSFGSMYSYSLAEEFQERIRAVVTYAVADYNIYEPHSSGKEKQLPIAWMNVHGKNDGTCPYKNAIESALPRVLKKNGKASDGDSKFTDASSEKPQEVGGSGHLCYDFKQVDERFPVKWCSWNGPHQWTAFDNGNWQNTWVPDEVHKFFEQF
ncbi:MAG: hypothetical protein MJZ05_01670 [Fibrobacter sp.]|nr:hypothetical protein [Fibrobacter sp.]